MKTYILIFASIILSQICYGQIAWNQNSVDSFTYFENNKLNKSTKYSSAIHKAHSKTAKKQIKAYLIKNLKYSQIMQDYCIEGLAEIKVVLDDQGQLVTCSLLNSPHEEVSNLIKKTLNKFNKISVKNSDYKGDNEIQLDITFSLQ